MGDRIWTHSEFESIKRLSRGGLTSFGPRTPGPDTHPHLARFVSGHLYYLGDFPKLNELLGGYSGLTLLVAFCFSGRRCHGV